MDHIFMTLRRFFYFLFICLSLSLISPVLHASASTKRPISIPADHLKSIFFIKVPEENKSDFNLGTAVLVSKSNNICSDIKISPFLKECQSQSPLNKLTSSNVQVYNFLTAYHVVEDRKPKEQIQFKLLDINSNEIPIQKSEVYKLPCIANPSLMSQKDIQLLKNKLNKDECFNDVAWIRVYTSYNLSHFMTLPKKVGNDVRDVQGVICGFGNNMIIPKCTTNNKSDKRITKVEFPSDQSVFFRKIGGSDHVVLALPSNPGASGGPIFLYPTKGKPELLGIISGRLNIGDLEYIPHVAFVPINVTCRMLAPICTTQKTK